MKNLGAQAERLDRRTGKLVRGARRYRDGLGGIAHAQTEFADMLREFCGGLDGTGTDEESMSIGGRHIDRCNSSQSFNIFCRRRT